MTRAAVRFWLRTFVTGSLQASDKPTYSMSANADATSAGGKTRRAQQGYEAFPSFLPQQVWRRVGHGFPDVSLWAKGLSGNCGFPDVCLWAKSWQETAGFLMLACGEELVRKLRVSSCWLVGGELVRKRRVS